MSRVVLIALSLAAAACAPEALVHPEAERLITERRANMAAMNLEMVGLGRQVSSPSPDPKQVEQHATRLAELASELLSHFPKGTGPEAGVPTLARRDVWTRSTEFKGLAEGMQDLATQLAEAARANELGDLKAQAMTLDATCVGCHRDFRVQ